MRWNACRRLAAGLRARGRTLAWRTVVLSTMAAFVSGSGPGAFSGNARWSAWCSGTARGCGGARRVSRWPRALSLRVHRTDGPCGWSARSAPTYRAPCPPAPWPPPARRAPGSAPAAAPAAARPSRRATRPAAKRARHRNKRHLVSGHRWRRWGANEDLARRTCFRSPPKAVASSSALIIAAIVARTPADSSRSSPPSIAGTLARLLASLAPAALAGAAYRRWRCPRRRAAG